ncbi:MAG TPA: TIGR03435 family protein [Bryobacteraceae bacterium]|nr:TIGR03435 family protein [Bryobacteraceae bacterium]
MKKSILWMATLIASLAGGLHAQNITGAWQGTLKAGPLDLRIVVKISLEDDKLKAVMYSIDQAGGQPIPGSSISKDGSIIKMKVDMIGGGYEGRLSADGNTINGTWTQVGMPMPLNLVRATPETTWTIPEPPPPPKLMAADATPSFEVATIKPAKPEGRFSLLVNRSGMLNTTSTSLSDLIKFAYDLHPRQITSGPVWLESEKYDITGKPDTPGMPNPKQLKAMVQKLLTERFQLTFHRDKKELSVYAISIAKNGSKLKKSESTLGLPGFGGGPRGLMVRNATIAEFASMLQANIVEQPVVDQTGLGDARWDFQLRWTPDPSQRQLGAPPGAPPPPPPGDDDPPPDLFAAFQQQLGLKLESTKAPVEVLVIDRVEKPSSN